MAGQVIQLKIPLINPSTGQSFSIISGEFSREDDGRIIAETPFGSLCLFEQDVFSVLFLAGEVEPLDNEFCWKLN